MRGDARGSVVVELKGRTRPLDAGEGQKERQVADEKKKSSLPRLLSLFVAFIGCVITVVPFAFGMSSDPAPIILVGSGVTVIALGLFLFFSI